MNRKLREFKFLGLSCIFKLHDKNWLGPFYSTEDNAATVLCTVPTEKQLFPPLLGDISFWLLKIERTAAYLDVHYLHKLLILKRHAALRGG